MSKSYYNNISKYLEGKRFNDIFIQENSSKLDELIQYCELNFEIKPSFKVFYEELYEHVKSNYRNDIVYKVELLDQLNELYSSEKKCYLINEFKVNRRLADLAIFNGSNIVFEIKSDIDKAKNIEDQFRNYQSFFDYIYLVTSKDRLEELRQRIPSTSGIFIFDESFNLSKVRDAEYNENQSIEKMFRLLRKKEYLNLVQKFTGSIPDVPNTKIWEVSLNLLKRLDFNTFKENFIEVIKSREGSYCLEDLKAVKKELRQGYLSNNFYPKKCTIHS